MDELYSNLLLEAAGSLPAARSLDAPSGQGRRTSKVCGSEVEVDLLLADGRVVDHALRVKACALGQASTSLLSQALNGASQEELRALKPVMEKMLREGGPAPEGRFAALEALTPIRDYPARHASTLLIFGAVVDALDEAAAKNAA
ncbi:iron-sulfur cluster assembly scaffold protein [Parvularcula sp. ZS-1/3]|uniref:Iron-sulfur cluster assembly scaffold protein n=1 Tax=Parvularcula mediterranea TaxID=2732508 RepID=A0A7Y3RMR3_9PROT|nr:iron-sulfur cluster assembly scaffold protein [Parvularcula mediterranea]NNU16951.1 iron-sulfur cluster assembly scaffold protein [Parvularcula mediterranea]